MWTGYTWINWSIFRVTEPYLEPSLKINKQLRLKIANDPKIEQNAAKKIANSCCRDLKDTGHEFVNSRQIRNDNFRIFCVLHL